MGVLYPIRKATAAVIGTTALSLIFACGARAQTTPDQGGTSSGGARKSEGSAKSGNAEKPGSQDAFDTFKEVKITLNADRENLQDTLRALMSSATTGNAPSTIPATRCSRTLSACPIRQSRPPRPTVTIPTEKA